jgi:hypothetical protein
MQVLFLILLLPYSYSAYAENGTENLVKVTDFSGKKKSALKERGSEILAQFNWLGSKLGTGSCSFSVTGQKIENINCLCQSPVVNATTIGKLKLSDLQILRNIRLNAKLSWHDESLVLMLQDEKEREHKVRQIRIYSNCRDMKPSIERRYKPGKVSLIENG